MSSEAIDEITVYGEQPIPILRREFYAAKENFFAAFNVLNSNDEFDIECDYESHLGSYRKYYECEPEFVKKYKEEVAQNLNPNVAALRRKEKLLVNEMLNQVTEHAELLEEFTKLARAKQIYESERIRRCILCQKD